MNFGLCNICICIYICILCICICIFGSIFDSFELGNGNAIEIEHRARARARASGSGFGSGVRRRRRIRIRGKFQLFEIRNFIVFPVQELLKRKKKRNTRSRPVAMLPNFSLPAVCMRAIHKGGSRHMADIVRHYGKFSCDMRYLLQILLYNLVSSIFSDFANLLSTAGLLPSSYFQRPSDAIQPLSVARMCGV